MAQDGGGCIAVGAIDEDARSQKNIAVHGVVQCLRDQVIARGVVVCPCFVVDLLRRRRLNVIQIETFFQAHHLLFCLFSLLHWRLLDRGQSAGIDRSQFCRGGETVFERAWRVDGIVFFGRVGAGELQNDLAPSRMVGQEGGDIVDISIEDDPARLFALVLLYFLECECLGHGG